MFLLLASLAAPALAVVVLALATRLTFVSMPCSALLGLRRAVFVDGTVVWVSRGILFPTAVYWFGGRDDQCMLVAQAIADGRISRFRAFDADTRSTRRYVSGCQCWPSAECRELFGKPGDTIPPE